MKTMRAKVGDRIVIRRHTVGAPDRIGEVIEVRGEQGRPPYIVRWTDDGHEGWFMPGSDAFIESDVVAGGEAP
jgi:hypothetical protein